MFCMWKSRGGEVTKRSTLLFLFQYRKFYFIINDFESYMYCVENACKLKGSDREKMEGSWRSVQILCDHNKCFLCLKETLLQSSLPLRTSSSLQFSWSSYSSHRFISQLNFIVIIIYLSLLSLFFFNIQTSLTQLFCKSMNHRMLHTLF